MKGCWIAARAAQGLLASRCGAWHKHVISYLIFPCLRHYLGILFAWLETEPMPCSLHFWGGGALRNHSQVSRRPRRRSPWRPGLGCAALLLLLWLVLCLLCSHDARSGLPRQRGIAAAAAGRRQRRGATLGAKRRRRCVRSGLVCRGGSVQGTGACARGGPEAVPHGGHHQQIITLGIIVAANVMYAV